ncbi:DUF302 domain-containing protein [Paraburkholderia sp. SIMBA_053]|uniref:DUF302 domain-containing protein n=1 Tax=Paraburkholderia sp. SIMBA_053 TaxID=3085794 RepID=UPI00397A24E8
MHENPAVRARVFTGVRNVVTSRIPFDDVISRLKAQCGHSTIAELVALAKEGFTGEDYANEVRRRYVGKSGFMLFSAIDHGGWIPAFGLHQRAVRWILGNPLIAITMLRHDLSAGLFAPVELLVTEEGPDGKCVITYLRPSSLIVIDGNPELEAAAISLDEKFDALVLNISGH